MKKYLLILLVISTFSCAQESETTKVDIDPSFISDSLINVYDSLMNINVDLPPLIDSTYFSIDCINQFEELARSTNGQLKIAIDPIRFRHELLGVIENTVDNNTDLLFIIDRTHSMKDDLSALKDGVDKLISRLEKFDNLNIGIATFGDKQIEYFPWYDFNQFQNDTEDARDFINQLDVHSGLDTPESVNDAIMQTQQENFWNSGNKHIAILLGDAPSHDSTKSEYSLSDVINYANNEKVTMNIYPIVLSPMPFELTKENGPTMQQQQFIQSIYPNPTTGLLSLNLETEISLTIEVFNLNGKLILSEKNSGTIQRVDLSEKPAGIYIIRVYDDKKNFETKKVIKK